MTVATAIIIPDLVVTTQPTNVNECVGGTDQMTVVVSGGSGTISYQWQSSADGIQAGQMQQEQEQQQHTYTPSSATAGTTYYRVLINATGSDCQQAVSIVATAIIIPDLVVTTQPTNVNECVGGTDPDDGSRQWRIRSDQLPVAVKCRWNKWLGECSR